MKSVKAPEWVTVLALVERFGMTIDEVLNTSQYWFERMAAYVDVIAIHQERESKKNAAKRR